MPNLYTKKWTDKNGTVRYYKDEEARNSIATLNGNSSVSGSVDNKIAAALADFGGFLVVPSLESVTDPNTHTIYLVKNGSALLSDRYEEYIYVAGSVNDFEKIGETSIDLSNYVQKTDTIAVEHGGTGATSAANARTNLGLGNVGNFKAVSTVASQGLTDTEKSNARANIGAGTSSFSGSYNDLSSRPTLGTAAEKNSTTSVTSGGTGLPTSGAVYTAINNAIGAALAASY